jgi:hypothetical protein
VKCRARDEVRWLRPKAKRRSSIVNFRETGVAGAQQKPGVHYGQRKQKSEKRDPETEEGETKGCACDFPPEFLTLQTAPAVRRKPKRCATGPSVNVPPETLMSPENVLFVC